MKGNPHNDRFVQMIQQQPGTIQAKNAKIMKEDMPEEARQYLFICLIRDSFIWITEYFHRKNLVVGSCKRDDLINCNSNFCNDNLEAAAKLTVFINSGQWTQWIEQ